MNGTVLPGSIVVGVDTSTSSMIALDWATQEAKATRSPMHLIHGFSHDRPDLIFNMGAEPADLYASGERVLVRARNRIQLRDRMIQVSSSHPEGYPAAALVRASKGARMVVVGSHGDSMLHISSLGETAHQVAAHAACPVAVVRKESDAGAAFGRITVGVDRSQDSADALAWAFDAAERSGSEVLAMHAWQPKDARDPGLGAADWPTYTAQCRSHIEQVIADQQAQHPQVKVVTDIADGNPTKTLLSESHASDLIVIGARGSGGFEGLALGRVARDVLAHAGCDVVLMH